MSMYGDDQNGKEKEHLYYTIEEFLENHPISELMEIIAKVLEYNEEH